MATPGSAARGLIFAGAAALAMWAPVLAAADEPVVLPLESGTRITATLRWPSGTGTSTEPLPVVILFGGLEGTRQVLDVMPVTPDTVLASFPYPYQPPRRLSWQNAKTAVDQFGRAVDDTFAGIAQLVAYLRAHPRIDPQRITLVGASAGAPFAGISAQRLGVPGVILIQGFGDLPRVLGRQADLAWRGDGWHQPFITRLLGRFLVAYLDLPEPAEAARRMTADQRVLMITAMQDHRIPAPSTEALWTALAASPAQVERIDQPGDHLRGLSDPRIPQLLGIATDWMQAQGLL